MLFTILRKHRCVGCCLTCFGKHFSWSSDLVPFPICYFIEATPAGSGSSWVASGDVSDLLMRTWQFCGGAGDGLVVLWMWVAVQCSDLIVLGATHDAGQTIKDCTFQFFLLVLWLALNAWFSLPRPHFYYCFTVNSLLLAGNEWLLAQIKIPINNYAPLQSHMLFKK